MIDFFSNYDGLELLLVIIAFFSVTLISLTMHELAHAYVAYKNGDQSPKAMGRLTFNPLAHIDTIGFLMFVIIGFGWAKPVAINPNKFRNYKKGMFLTSIAGVVTNYILAFISSGIFYLLIFYGSSLNYNVFFFLYHFLNFMFLLNITLFVFNLLPFPPLDGFKVIETFTKYNNKFVVFMHKYGTLIALITLLFILQINVTANTTLFEYLINIAGLPIEKFWNAIFF